MRAFQAFMKTYSFGPHTIRESEVFYHSKLCIGLVNLKPIAPGHVLVVPRRVVPRFTDLTSDEVCDMMLSVQKIGKVIEKEYKGDSLTVAIQDGPAAGQTVPHAHVHVIPRRFGDWANNDDVYKELDQRKPGHSTKVDNEGRKPRSLEEMKEEADRLRMFFEPAYPDE